MPPHPTFLCRPLYLGHRALLTYRRVAAVPPAATRSALAQQDKSGPVVPVRNFGRGRTGTQFGHGRYNWDNPWSKTVWVTLGFGVLAPFIDWEGIYDRTGFYVPGLFYAFTRDWDGSRAPHSITKDFDVRNSIPEDLRERQKEVHEFMIEQTQRGYGTKSVPYTQQVSEEDANKMFLDMVKTRKEVKAEEKSNETGILDIVRAKTSV